MALTRSQLIAGNSANGIVLPGQPQGVIAGAGITINSGGIISVNAATAVGVMRLNNPAAYNAYVWPLGGGSAGQQLTSDGAGNLSWGDSDGIPWTAKGQLVVGTGIGTDVLLNAGANTAVLMADSTTASGLVYSNTVTSAMQSPAGATTQRPNPATAGQFRYNTTTQKFEFATGPTTWEQFASSDPLVGTFVSQTVPTTGSPSAIIPAGTTAQQQTVPAPLAGYTRFNTSTSLMEVFDGLVWTPVGAPILSATLAEAAVGVITTKYSSPETAVPKDASGMTGAALLPAGTSVQQPAAPVDGMFRFNTTNDAFEGYGQNATAWEALMPTGAATDKTIYLNNQTVTTNYTLPAAPIIKNGLSAGPITIATGVTVTVPAGQAWSIV